MSKNKLPLGLLLKNAGLISDERLQKALAIQAKYTKMKLGEILVLQEGIQAKTIDFFVNSWQKLVEKGRKFPIGYYLNKAGLLDDRQIETILQEQENSQQKFGAIAVQKGWIAPQTVTFFLDSLPLKPALIVPFSWLEEYDEQTLHLAKKYVNHSLILSRIFAWTGGNSNLIKIIAPAFTESSFNIPTGLEIGAVDRFVEKNLIENWQKSDRATYIRTVARNLVNNRQCSPQRLLQEYQKILLSGSQQDRSTPEQEELLALGLIVRDREEREKLRVANLIYQQVFDRNWTTRQLDRLQNRQIDTQKSLAIAAPITTTNNVDSTIVTKPIEVERQNQNSNSFSSPNPLTKIGSIVTLCSLVLLVPLFLLANNYYFSRLREPSNDNSIVNADRLQQFCQTIDFSNSSAALQLISKLETDKRKLLENFSSSSDSLEIFPNNCEAALNRLRVLAAPQLGKENRVLEAIRHLCKIPADSEMSVEAEVWLDRWYNSSAWGRETKFLLSELDKYDEAGCPAGHFTEYDES